MVAKYGLFARSGHPDSSCDQGHCIWKDMLLSHFPSPGDNVGEQPAIY